MRWIVQIAIPPQAAFSWDNLLLIKGHLLKAYKSSCQKQPDVSTQHQSMTSLRILTWTTYGWAGVVAIYESPFWYNLYIVCTSLCRLWSYYLFGVMSSFKPPCSIMMFWAWFNNLWNTLQSHFSFFFTRALPKNRDEYCGHGEFLVGTFLWSRKGSQVNAFFLA